jgi:subtilisin family serine protease
MMVAVLDGGFQYADHIPALKRINKIGERDFVFPPSHNIYREHSHGMKVLSVMAVNEKNLFEGSAPEAEYWLLRCEQTQTESRSEEDFWAAAAEFADSVGVDVINSSLGYSEYDDDEQKYPYRQLDGHSMMISRMASMLAQKGIVLVCSAGNSGDDSWKKITIPADAEDVLTVGAVTSNGINTVFSSVGPTADGRVKPDVMALGGYCSVINADGEIAQQNGTSFASPLIAGAVACLWQALPDKTACELIELVRQSGDRYQWPDNIYGYGIPDFAKILEKEKYVNGNK